MQDKFLNAIDRFGQQVPLFNRMVEAITSRLLPKADASACWYLYTYYAYSACDSWNVSPCENRWAKRRVTCIHYADCGDECDYQGTQIFVCC
jgi:hypothetical protein